MTTFGLPDLPEALRARLEALGATGEDGIRAALDRDPALRAEFEAFLAANQPQIDALVAEAFDAFLAARDSAELLALTQHMPFVLDDSFAQLVQEALDDARAQGEPELVAGLEARLAGLEEIRGRGRLSLAELLESVAAVGDPGGLLALAQREPAVLEDRFLQAAEIMAAEQARTDARAAAALRDHLAVLQDLRQQREIAQSSPLIQALIAFLNAHTEDEARALFGAHRQLLGAEDAQSTLAAFFQGADAESQARIDERAALLAALRTPPAT